MLEWYIPWDQIDWGLKLQMLVWLAAVLCSYWICWRTLIRKRPWLRNRRRASDSGEAGPAAGQKAGTEHAAGTATARRHER